MSKDMEKNIVVNDSKAYGYNYASLSDIAKQGFKIPKMKTGTETEKEYVYYYDNQTPAEIASAIKAAKASEFESSNVLESLDREFSNNIKALLEC